MNRYNRGKPKKQQQQQQVHIPPAERRQRHGGNPGGGKQQERDNVDWQRIFADTEYVPEDFSDVNVGEEIMMAYFFFHHPSSLRIV